MKSSPPSGAILGSLYIMSSQAHVPRLRLQQVPRAPHTSSSDSDEATTPTLGPRDMLWKVDEKDLNTMWLSPRDKEEALKHLKTESVPLSGDGLLGVIVAASNTKKRKSRSRSNSSSSSSSRKSRKQRDVVATIRIHELRNRENPALDDIVAAGKLAVGDVIRFFNGVFVDCCATFDRLCNEAAETHEADLAAARLKDPAATLVSTVSLGVCPSACYEMLRAKRIRRRAESSSSRSRASRERSHSGGGACMPGPRSAVPQCLDLGTAQRGAERTQSNNQPSPDTPRPSRPHSDQRPSSSRDGRRRRGPKQQCLRQSPGAPTLQDRRKTFQRPTSSMRDLRALMSGTSPSENPETNTPRDTLDACLDRSRNGSPTTIPIHSPTNISHGAPASLPSVAPQISMSTSPNRLPATHRKRRSSLSAAAATIIANAASCSSSSTSSRRQAGCPEFVVGESPSQRSKVSALERDWCMTHRRSRSDSNSGFEANDSEAGGSRHRRVCSDGAGKKIADFTFSISRVLGASPRRRVANAAPDCAVDDAITIPVHQRNASNSSSGSSCSIENLEGIDGPSFQRGLNDLFAVS